MSTTVFGRYQLMELIAKGGMAEVFKARLAAAAGTEKLVCIKRVLPHLSQNSDFMRLFIGEARIALPLNHGNITQVFDFGEVEGVYYLAMEFIRGQNLQRVIGRLREQGRSLDVATALYIATEVCKGLHYAHTFSDASGRPQAVVHRDVSPHNVLISYGGQVKLADFGIALAASKAGDDGVVRGKPCYLSPEQAASASADPRSDIFSLGVVLYEMLTGVRCFEGEGEADTLQRVREARVEAPSERNPVVSAEIDAVVLRALQRDPADRYQRASDLQVALARLLHQQASDYTADTLARLMGELFAAELGEGSDGDPQRDRLLLQLAQAGVEVAHDANTAELLEMGTVAIESAGSDEAPPAWRRYAPWVGGGLGLVIAAVAALVVIGGTGGGHQQARPDAMPPLPRIGPTEHLTPSSLQNPSRAASEPVANPGADGGAKQERQAVARRVGFINCNSWPWSVVYLDGRRLPGNTPVYRVKVAVGRHRLKFVNPELGLSKEVAVSVGPDEVKTVAVSLQ